MSDSVDMPVGPPPDVRPLDFFCPWCGVDVGQNCRSSNGKTLAALGKPVVHNMRVRFALSGGKDY